jgi:26S proteasome regulatory subunit N1
MLYLAGTGNVLKIQNLLHICSEHYEEKEKEAKEPKESDSRDSKDAKGKQKEAAAAKEEPKSKLDGSHQGVAVLGISLIAMGEEIGAQMALRTFRHLVSSSNNLLSSCNSTTC